MSCFSHWLWLYSMSLSTSIHLALNSLTLHAQSTFLQSSTIKPGMKYAEACFYGIIAFHGPLFSIN